MFLEAVKLKTIFICFLSCFVFSIQGCELYPELIAVKLGDTVNINNKTLKTQVLDGDPTTCDTSVDGKPITRYELTVTEPFLATNFCLSVEFESSSDNVLEVHYTQNGKDNKVVLAKANKAKVNLSDSFEEQMFSKVKLVAKDNTKLKKVCVVAIRKNITIEQALRALTTTPVPTEAPESGSSTLTIIIILIVIILIAGGVGGYIYNQKKKAKVEYM